MYMILTIDTGGTKTLISSFGRDGKMGESIKFPTPGEPAEYAKMLKKVYKKKRGIIFHTLLTFLFLIIIN